MFRPAFLLVFLIVAAALMGEWVIRAQSETALHTALAQKEALATGGVRTATQIVERTLDLARTVHSIASLARNHHLHGLATEAKPLERILTDLALEERSSILQIAMIDSDGQLAFSTVPGWTTLDLTDREHFRVHLNGLRTPFLSAPLVGRASGRWSVQVTQAILCDRTGDFAGVVVVSVDPLLISGALRQNQLDTESVTTLLRLDGTVLARTLSPETVMGQRLPDPLVRRFQGVGEGVQMIPSPFTGEELTVAWRQVEHWPLVVAHGLRRSPVLEAAQAQAARWRMQLLPGLGTVTALCVAGLLWRSRRLAAGSAAQAEASRRDMADLVAALPGAAYRGVIDSTGRLTLIQTTEALSGLTGQDEAEGEQAADWAPMLDADGVKLRAANHAAAIASRQSAAEYRLRRADGRWIWVRDHVRARRRGGGPVTEIVGVLTDITQEREIAAQAVASAKLATLGEMATGLAHELNQPASAIALAADIAAVEWDSGDATRQARARERLEMIARQTMRMRDIVQHLQIFGRSDPKSQRMEAVSLDDALAGALSLVHGSLNASGVALDVDIPSDLPPVRGQLVPLEQVLVNLLLNARDAMEAVEPAQRRVAVAGRFDEALDQVHISIRDHGPGFSPEQRTRAFEPFYTTKPTGKGTGLGLSIAYGTITSFGGRIRLDNAEGGGAELVLELPVIRAEKDRERGSLDAMDARLPQ